MQNELYACVHAPGSIVLTFLHDNAGSQILTRNACVKQLTVRTHRTARLLLRLQQLPNRVVVSAADAVSAG
jgi:hypothetical protein